MLCLLLVGRKKRETWPGGFFFPRARHTLLAVPRGIFTAVDVIILARSNQNYPSLAKKVSRFLVSWSLGFLIPYPGCHFESFCSLLILDRQNTPVLSIRPLEKG
jgi:hypothetical protein